VKVYVTGMVAVFAGMVYVKVNAPPADVTGGRPESAPLTFRVKVVPSGSLVVPEIVTGPPEAGSDVVEAEMVMVTGIPASVTLRALDRFAAMFS